MGKYLTTPKVQIAGILFLFFLVSTPIIDIPKAAALLITCLFFTVTSDLVFTYVRRHQLFTRPFAAIVTGLILTLIIDPSAPWYQIFIICASAMAIKNFIRPGKRHVLNPAASGLLVGFILFASYPSWWAATLHRGENAFIFNVLIYILLAAMAYASAVRLGRYVSILSYIGIYSLLFLAITESFSMDSLFKTIVNPGMFFYALVMLPEPMTSPVNKKRQMMYGAVIALFNALLVFASLRLGIANIPDGSIIALLIGNALFFKFR